MQSQQKERCDCLLEARAVLPSFRKRLWKTIDTDVNYLSSLWEPWPPALAGDVRFQPHGFVLQGPAVFSALS